MVAEKGVGGADRHLGQLQTSQQHLYSCIQRKCEPKLLEKAQHGTSEAAVKALIEDVKERLEEKALRERTSCGLCTSKVRAFGARTDEFLKTFSGLVAIVKGIDNRFGPIAFGTLSLFLAIATLKEQYTRTVIDTIENTSDWLPRLEVINTLGTQMEQTQIEIRVFEVYEEILIFLTGVADHLQQSWLARTWEVVAKPPEYHLKLQEERLRSKTKLLLEEVLIQNWTQATYATKARPDRQKDEHQSQQDMVLTSLAHHIPEMRLIAAEDADFPLGMIRKCRRMYSGGIFATYHRAAQTIIRLQEINLNMIRATREYTEWAGSKDSALLILAGQNYDDSVSQSWLSPATVDFYTSLDQQPNTMAAFCSIDALAPAARRSSVGGGRRRRSHEDELQWMLMCVLYQLLEADPRLCRENHHRIIDYCASASSSASSAAGRTDNTTSDEQQIAACFMLLSSVLTSAAARNQQIYIVLSGLERWSPPHATKALIGGLLELFRDVNKKTTTTTVMVKVLVTCSWADSFPQVRDTADRDELRHALGLGANRDLMENVFGLFLMQRERDAAGAGAEGGRGA